MDVGEVKFDVVATQTLNFVKVSYPQFNYEVIKEYPQDLVVWGSALGIKDIILNGVNNSCHAMIMKQESHPEYKPKIIIRGRTNDKTFFLEIEDNGLGIKKENIHKVMDPMYSTKGHRQGTGMGTTFMKQIVLKHKGTIVYESEWDQWTRVKITLPLGVIAKSEITRVGPNGAMILAELIKKEVLEDRSPAEVRVKSNLDQKEDLVKEIAKDDFEEIWAILQFSPSKTKDQKGA
jgi:hypothetical protein